MKKSDIYFEFYEFLRKNKKLWLLPILIIFGLIAAVLIVAKTGGAIAPFAYTLF